MDTNVTSVAFTSQPNDMPEAVAKAVTDVMKKVRGVEKTGKNSFHGYKYATIGELMAVLQPSMADAGLIITQTELDAREMHGMLAIRYAFSLSHSSGATWRDALIHTGLATMINAKGVVDDKAANKCMQAARKYALLALFHIPSLEEGDERLSDGDVDRQENQPAPKRVTRAEVSRFEDAMRGATDKADAEKVWLKNADLLKAVPKLTLATYVNAWRLRGAGDPPAIDGLDYPPAKQAA